LVIAQFWVSFFCWVIKALWPHAISVTLQTPVAVEVLLNAQNPPLATVKYSGTLGGIFMLLDVTVAETADPSNCNQPCTSEHTRTCVVNAENAVDGTDAALPP
jgi:hypothetical protein